MTTQAFTTTTTAQADRNKPTAADLAQAQAILTGPTIIVCGLTTLVLTIIANVIGFGIAVAITALVLLANANVRRMSIQNAIADRLEREGRS